MDAQITEIRSLYAGIESILAGAAQAALPKALRIGELLAEKKAAMRHGEFLPWVAENLPFSERTAHNYMLLHRERDRLKSASVADLKGAYRLLDSRPRVGFHYPKGALPLPEAGKRLVGTCGDYTFIVERAGAESNCCFFITSLYLPAAGERAADGTKRAFPPQHVEQFIRILIADAHQEFTKIEWASVEDSDPTDFNRWLYDDHADYMRREIMAWGENKLRLKGTQSSILPVALGMRAMFDGAEEAGEVVFCQGGVVVVRLDDGTCESGSVYQIIMARPN